MKIVYFYPHLKSLGGIEKGLSVKTRYLAEELGHEVTVITYRQFGGANYFPLSEKVTQINLDIPDPDLSGSFIRKRKNYRNFMATYRHEVETFLRTNPQDIAISLFFGKEFLFLPDLKDGSSKILGFHFTFEESVLKNFDNLKLNSLQNIKDFFYLKNSINTIKKYDRFIVLTDEDRKNWVRFYPNVDFIYNPLFLKSDLKSSLKQKSVLALGRLTEAKGFNFLIDAWKLVYDKHPDWQLNIYGSGELKSELNKQIQQNNLENVVRINPPTTSVGSVFFQHSVFVLSSIQEGFGNVLLEAKEFGLPTVAFDCNYGPKEIITDGVDGFLVTNKDIRMLAKKISSLIDDEDLRHRFALKGLEKVEKFSVNHIMHQWNQLFLNLVKEKQNK